jgi:hypothetical protein
MRAETAIRRQTGASAAFVVAARPGAVDFQSASRNLMMGLLMVLWEDMARICRKMRNAAYETLAEIADTQHYLVQQILEAWQR